MKILARAWRMLIVLWAGSLWSLLWVAAVVFHFQSDRHTAGLIAGRLFSIETYLGLAIAALALLLPERTRFFAGFVAVALLAINEWVLKAAMTACADARRQRVFEFRRVARHLGGALRAGMPLRLGFAL